MSLAIIAAATTSIVTIIGALTSMIVIIRSHNTTAQAMTTALRSSVPAEMVTGISSPKEARFTKLSGQPYTPES